MSADESRAAAEELRRALHRAADWVADSWLAAGAPPVFPATSPGEVAACLPATAPREGEPLERLLDDFHRLVEPHLTRWNHPRFLAYFAITGSPPGVLGELLAASLNVNAMLWRTSPAATELEATVCGWLRDALGLPEGFSGHINDTASISTFLALAAARERATEGVARERGLAGLPPLVVYTSEQAHSSIEKAVIALGLGHRQVRKIAVDDEYRLRAEALAAAIAEDRAAGRRPIAVVAAIGTTATTSVDPVEAIGGIARREGLWLHVDAAYAGAAAICPERRGPFAGWERADSIVVNPHKWLFVPVDCSVLWVRDPAALRAAFSLVPEYLRTAEDGVTNLMDLGLQLGRRFRALKLWFVLRHYGLEGLRAKLREHLRLAAGFAAWLADNPPGAGVTWELAAPVIFSTVCFRARLPAGAPEEAEDALNARLVDTINRSGLAFLSTTRLRGRTVIRVAIGHWQTSEDDLRRVFEALSVEARQGPVVPRDVEGR